RRGGQQAQRERVHMIERRRDQVAMTLEPRRKPHLRNPDMTLMREHHTLRHTGSARRIEKHCGFAPARDDHVERPSIDKWIKAAVPLAAELNAGKIGRAIASTRGIAKDKPGARIPDDEVNGLARKLEVDRHSDEAGAHDAEIGCEIFGAIGRKNSDTIATL